MLRVAFCQGSATEGSILQAGIQQRSVMPPGLGDMLFVLVGEGDAADQKFVFFFFYFAVGWTGRPRRWLGC